jgi:serralysin
MGKALFHLAWAWFTLTALAIAPADAYIINNRWTRTATNSSTGSQGTPITLTWSFPTDEVLIPGNTIGTTVANNLRNFLDSNWGVGPGGSDLTQRPWFPIFEQSFARLSALSGVNYVYEPNDNGANFSDSTSGRGVLGVRGDIRLGGRSYGGGSNTLASNYYPQYGEMIINTDQVGYFRNSTNDYRGFRNTLMHELMHGLGINHVESSSSGFLIEPILSTSFDGPQLDDLLAIQRNYGDANEKNGGNDVFGNATPLGEVSPLQPASIGTPLGGTVIAGNQVGFLSIDDNSDSDFFRFSLSSRLDVALQLTPQGTNYQVGPQDGTQSEFNSLALSDLSLSLLGPNGTSILETANLNAAGASESIARRLLPGTYYVRVNGQADDIQLYNLGITASQPPAINLVWTGTINQDWNVGTTANFADVGTAALFYDGDHVTFDDSSSVKNVQLTQNVAAGEIQVETADHYVFSGSGGIVAGDLTVSGSGVVELANSGNSYQGDTHILAGTLAITGDANAMRSAITIAAGATLRMDAVDAATMTSSFTIEPDGTLEIGTESSSGNVFPDTPSAIVNEGQIRVRTSEALRSVSGSGRIDIENGTTEMDSNPGFAGMLNVKTGATAQLHDRIGLGTDEVRAHVESGGMLQLAENGLFSQSFELDASATLQVSGENDFLDSAKLAGSGQVVGDLLMPGTIAPGSEADPAGDLSITGNLALTDTSRVEFQLGGSEAGIDFTSIQVDGSVTLGGTLTAAFVLDFAPAHDDTFELLTAVGELSGEFDSVTLPEVAAGFEWSVIYNPHSVALHLSAPITVLPGDFNQDGNVDAADYTVWRDGLGENYTEEDYSDWKSHFGQSSGGSSNSLPSAAVPDPASIVLLAIGVLSSLATRSAAAVGPNRRLTTIPVCRTS